VIWNEFLEVVASPKKDLSCVFTVGLGKSRTEFIFFADIDIPSLEIVRPTYSTLVSPNLHLEALG
jgi:hypothetical protein